MDGLLAIVGDTWKQSKQQVVFLILLGLMFLSCIAVVALVEVREREDGAEFLAIVFQDDDDEKGIEELWISIYRQALIRDQGNDTRVEEHAKEMRKAMSEAEDARRKVGKLRKNGAPAEEIEAAEKEARRLEEESGRLSDEHMDLLVEVEQGSREVIQERSKEVGTLEKGVEAWMYAAVIVLFKISMWLFIAACAGYFPNMLAAGAVDVLVSRPIRRYQIFFGKYAGGLALYSAALLGAYTLLFVGMGVRTGVWHFQFFGGMPLTLFSVALLFAIVAWIGVRFRSTALAMIIGYLFYFVIDSMIGFLQAADQIEFTKDISWLAFASKWAKILFPSFDRMGEAAAAAVVNVPIFEWQPLLVGLGWLALCLFVAFNRFRRMDF